MVNPKQTFLNSLKRCNRILHAEIKDITHAESLVQPPYNVNRLNWVLGHILTARDNSLRLLHLHGQLSEAFRLAQLAGQVQQAQDVVAGGEDVSEHPVQAVDVVGRLDQAFGVGDILDLVVEDAVTALERIEESLFWVNHREDLSGVTRRKCG